MGGGLGHSLCRWQQSLSKRLGIGLHRLPITCLVLQGLKAALHGEVDNHWSCWPHLARKMVQKACLLNDKSEKWVQEVSVVGLPPAPPTPFRSHPISCRTVVCRCMPCSPMRTCAAPISKGWHTWRWCLHTCARKGRPSLLIGLSPSIVLKMSMTGEACLACNTFQHVSVGL